MLKVFYRIHAVRSKGFQPGQSGTLSLSFVLSDNQLHLVSSWLGSLYLPLSYSLARASSEYSVSRGHVTCMGQQCDYQAVFNVERVSLVDG